MSGSRLSIDCRARLLAGLRSLFWLRVVVGAFVVLRAALHVVAMMTAAAIIARKALALRVMTVRSGILLRLAARDEGGQA